MRRISILGCSGTGKSTLARRLGEALGLPVVHIDQVFWRPGWKESERDDFRVRLAAALSGDGWIVDGNYVSSADLFLPHADTIVWLERPRWLCLWRVIRRALSYRPGSRPDMAPGCPERLDPAFWRYVWTWDRQTRPRTDAAIVRYGGAARLIRLRTTAETECFLTAACAAKVEP